MADNSPRGARLDHVSDAGDLVFVAGGEKFLVTVDEKLERAILEAKQIRLEASGQQQPQTHDTLPISKIQQLIRAGFTPSEVAEQYNLNEALVRRFSSSVQTEKQYAIEQFKRVPAPKESRAHTVEDLIAIAISESHIERDTLVWSATRRGHEPWHIFADFMISGEQMRAEWTWNMHDNSVVSLNDIAKRIMEEHRIVDRSPNIIFDETVPLDDMASAHTADGDSPSPTIPLITERVNGTQRLAVDTVAYTAQTAEAMANEHNETDGSRNGGDEGDAANGDERGDSPDQHAENAGGTDTNTDANATDTQNAEGNSGTGDDGQPQSDDTQSQSTDQPQSDPNTPETRSITSEQAVAAQDAMDTDETPRVAKTVRAKRRSGRSAVPSWDEILFGE